ncbi:MAG: CPXCG motif-containing cysteine-rich protein [Gammaproteobacteria bacterium]|nr:CPXCG motif-containing cysteine-rich protein [Gammaproteobacteria bacterium]MDE2346762.1 CPXCG motif-containing cysteine-rich protein [Gammaproteobacteria bacterium]
MHNTVCVSVQCPYCGENIDLLVDCSVENQHYVEDCLVCCRPMDVRVSLDGDGRASVVVSREDDA